MRKILAVALAALLLLQPAIVANANKVEKVKLMPDKGHGAQVEVYSTNGEAWTNVDKTKSTTFKATQASECKYKGAVTRKNPISGSLSVEGFKRLSGGTTVYGSGPITGKFKYEGNANINPVHVCNKELQKRQNTNPNKTKYHILADGFKIKYDGAFQGKYTLTCKATGAGANDYKADKAYMNATINCRGSGKAKNKIPKPAPKPSRAKKVKPLVKATTFVADPKSHTGKCPVGVRFKGTISTNMAGEVKYQYVSNDGKKSPVFTLKFNQAGKKNTGNWVRTLDPTKTDKGSLSAGGGASNTYKGWTRLVIVSPKGPTKTANFTIKCQTGAKPVRMKTSG